MLRSWLKKTQASTNYTFRSWYPSKDKLTQGKARLWRWCWTGKRENGPSIDLFLHPLLVLSDALQTVRPSKEAKFCPWAFSIEALWYLLRINPTQHWAEEKTQKDSHCTMHPAQYTMNQFTRKVETTVCCYRAISPPFVHFLWCHSTYQAEATSYIKSVRRAFA